ncbi:MAG: UDP-N-acetylmuramoyl-L-alanine--D-glutamate ligase [Oligoflexales bacterium]
MTWMVLGAGRSGIAAAKLLAAKKHKVVLTDQRIIPSSTKKDLIDLGIDLRDQDEGNSLCSTITSGIVLSPGITQTHPYIKKAKQQGLPTVSEVELALSYYKGIVISVTGTNGKSTTVSMAYHLLRQMGYNAALAGNIGTPPSEIIRDKPHPKIMILELSSYQLEQSSEIRSQVAAILNLIPDHLARHGSLEQYLLEKWKLVLMCPKDSHALVDSQVFSMASQLRQPQCHLQVIDPNLAIAQVDPNESGQHEWHNRLNGFYAASLVAQLIETSVSRVIPYLASYRGLSHRFEKIGTINGATVINDSKATNVDSTLVALSNLHKATVLLIGGQGKGESFTAVKKYRSLIQSLIVFGQEAPKIVEELKEMNPIVYPSLKTTMDALPGILSLSVSNPDLLFSPACASFDEFKNFEERGEYFKSKIKSLLDIQ